MPDELQIRKFQLQEPPTEIRRAAREPFHCCSQVMLLVCILDSSVRFLPPPPREGMSVYLMLQERRKKQLAKGCSIY